MVTSSARPRLSVVMPAHNGGDWIRASIDSVLTSTFTDLELIVRDDGSTDGTREYLSSLTDPRVHVVFAESNGGPWMNWTEVSKLARGDFVKVLCQDDLVFANCLERHVTALSADPSVSMVASRHHVIDSSGSVVIRAHGLHGLVGKMSGETALYRSVITGANQFGEPASVTFRTEILKSSLPFDPQYPYLTDLDMYRKVLAGHNFLGIGSVDAAFRVSTVSWSKRLENTQSSEFIAWIDTFFGSPSSGFSARARIRAIIMVRLRTFARRLVVGFIQLRSGR
jgi:glycosyltransferase involved in cell wall biosynthesis